MAAHLYFAPLTGQVRRDGRKWLQVRRPNLGRGGELDGSGACIKTRDRRGQDTVLFLFVFNNDKLKIPTTHNKSLQRTLPIITMKLTIALVLCLVAVATAAPYVPVVPVIPAVVHHPASVVRSSTVIQSHPSPVATHVVAVPAAVAHPVAVHPAVSVHPVAIHPVLPVHTVVHY
ncbi:uncharacterized protein LOC132920230 [Rhopalosiphum padi]|uniref:uncharacterized protein LOC132920230 n=1 Tax=Rhopalosiphum padi TaxID=40932 RepID=UPI00298E712F|nr:uncharacterized protein LOC132920230 [Rhopalosiphum padi]